MANGSLDECFIFCVLISLGVIVSSYVIAVREDMMQCKVNILLNTQGQRAF